MPVIDLTAQPAAAAQVIKVDGPPPDGDWLLALDVRKTATKRTTRLWGQIENSIAKPLLVLEDTLTTPTHATAIAQTDGSFKQEIGELKLNYKTTLTPQNEASMFMSFPSGLITRVDLEGQDSGGTALELGGQAIAPTATSLNLSPFMGNSLVTQILFKIMFSDSSVTQYLIPLTR